MTEKELRVRQYENDVVRQGIKVREAKVNLEEGHKRLLANFEADYSKLKIEYELEVVKLDREKLFLEYAKADLARGYSE